MASIKNVLYAVNDFLNDAQSLGIIKEFTLTQCDISYEEVPGADILLSKFLQKLNVPSISAKNSSSDDEYIVIDDEKRSESDSTLESPTKENPEMPSLYAVSPESCSSSVTEQVSEDEKKSESISTNDSPEKAQTESIPESPKMINETKEDDALEFSPKQNLVQINVDTNEMKRRITAFITRKRKEVDEWNVQEFCGRSYIDEQDPAWEQFNTCARVDAVFVPRRGCKSHIKVSKVQNVWGPQTPWQPETRKIKQEPGENEDLLNDASLHAIDERMLNMETHLKLKSDSTLRTNIFQRLRNLEDRILLLESTSPEYIYMANPDSSPKKRKRSTEEKIYSNCSIDEIQKRIQTLKTTLKLKASQVKNESNF